jgi:hypothetical protein
LSSDELHNLYFSADIIWVTKKKRRRRRIVGWAGHVVHMGVMGNAHKDLLRELETRGH